MIKLEITAVLAMGILAGAVSAAEPAALTTQKEKVSYSIGITLGENWKKQSIDVDVALVSKGLQDAISSGKPLLTTEEIQKTLTAFQTELAAQQQERAKVMGDKNKKEGEAFLTANKKKEGVVTLPSGLQYKVLKEGTGPSPKAADTVTAQYRGTLLDGTEFDSSYLRKEPATFPLTHVIKGWSEALQLMKVGSKWQLFVPADLAYGERGSGPTISPNATLIFEVELVSIKAGS